MSQEIENTEELDPGQDTEQQQLPDMEEVDRIATKRSEQGSRAAVKDFFKQHGLSEDEAEAAFADYKKAKEERAAQERNNLTALQQKVDSFSAEKEQLIEMANLRLVRGAAMVKAAQMNIRPDRVEHAIKLADLTGIEVDDNGDVNNESLTQALEKVTQEMPELLKSEDGKHGFKLGASDQNQNATEDQINQIFGLKG